MMWHPFWQDGHMPSHVAVQHWQFTVMVRTDDRRTWELRNEMGDAFIDDLIAEIDLDRPLSLAERRGHVALYRATAARRPPTWRRSDFPRLFGIMADKFKDIEVERNKVPKGSFVETPYIVDIKDQRAIGSGLGLMSSFNYPPAANLAINQHAAKADNAQFSAPSGLSFMREVLELCALNMRRRARIYEGQQRASGQAGEDEDSARLRQGEALVSAVETLGWQAPNAKKGVASGMGGLAYGARRESTPTDRRTEIPDSKVSGSEFA